MSTLVYNIGQKISALDKQLKLSRFFWKTFYIFFDVIDDYIEERRWKNIESGKVKPISFEELEKRLGLED